MASIKRGINAIVCISDTAIDSFASEANVAAIYEVSVGAATATYRPGGLNSLTLLKRGSTYWVEAILDFELANAAPPLSVTPAPTPAPAPAPTPTPVPTPSLLINSDFSAFSTGELADGWSTIISGAAVATKVTRSPGNFAQQFEITELGPWGAYLYQSKILEVGARYSVSFEYMTSREFGLQFQVINGPSTQQVFSTNLNGTGGVWTSVSGLEFTYDNALADQVRFYSQNLGAFAVDNVVLTKVGTTPAPAPAPTPSPTPTGAAAPTTLAIAARFLNQATFGAKSTEAAALVGGSYDTWINAQFAQPMTSCVQYVLDYGPDAYMNQVMEFWWDRVINGSDQLRNRIAFALSEIFVVSAVGPLEIATKTIASYWDILQVNTFTNFRKLLEDLVYNPGMGVYLSYQNNYEDLGRGILADENFAREIMQLFTIGLVQLNQDGTPKLDSTGKTIPTYDNNVIKGMAKVFTGLWSPDAGDGNQAKAPMAINEGQHSETAKTIVGGVTLAANRTFVANLKDTLDALFNHPNAPSFFSRQLIQRLTASNPTPAYVKRVADVFVNNGAGIRGDMKAIIKAIFLDVEARDLGYGLTAPTAGKIREPILMLSQLMRSLNARSTSGSKLTFWNLESPYDLGQNPLRAPSVFGFFRADYAPKNLKDMGITAPEFGIFNMISTICRANNWLNWIKNGLLYGEVRVDISPYRGLNTSQLLDSINNLFCGGQMSAITRNAITLAVDATSGDDRIYTALHLTFISPDYGVQK